VAAVLECEETPRPPTQLLLAVMHRLNLVLNLIDHVANMAQKPLKTPERQQIG